jgi:group I intron endonuclease
VTKRIITLYKITNLTNDRCYIGLTKETPLVRFMRHKRHGGEHLHRPLREDIRKYGAGEFKVETLAVCNCNDYAANLERAAIQAFGSHISVGGYNIAYGGWGCHYDVSAEIREKMAAAKRGKPRTEETKKKISAYMKTRTITEETRKKLSIAFKNRFVSAETKRKQSASAKKRCARKRAKIGRVSAKSESKTVIHQM